MNTIWVVEVKSGYCEDRRETMLFDSVWSTEEKARGYCKKFHPSTGIGGFTGDGWAHKITKVEINKGE